MPVRVDRAARVQVPLPAPLRVRRVDAASAERAVLGLVVNMTHRMTHRRTHRVGRERDEAAAVTVELDLLLRGDDLGVGRQRHGVVVAPGLPRQAAAIVDPMPCPVAAASVHKVVVPKQRANLRACRAS